MAGTLAERSVRLLIFDERHDSHSIEVSFSPSATAGALIRRFLEDPQMQARHGMRGDETTHVLIDPRSQAGIPADAPLLRAQLLNGQILQILPRARAVIAERPVLSADDHIRLVVEGGPQVGMAWPLSLSSSRLRLDVEEDTGVLKTSTSTHPTLVVDLNLVEEGIEVTGQSHRLLVDGVSLADLLREQNDFESLLGDGTLTPTGDESDATSTVAAPDTAPPYAPNGAREPFDQQSDSSTAESGGAEPAGPPADPPAPEADEAPSSEAAPAASDGGGWPPLSSQAPPPVDTDADGKTASPGVAEPRDQVDHDAPTELLSPPTLEHAQEDHPEGDRTASDDPDASRDSSSEAAGPPHDMEANTHDHPARGAEPAPTVDNVWSAPRYGTLTVMVGSSITVMDNAGEGVLVLLRVLEAETHESSLPVSPVVPYRVVPSEYHPRADEPVKLSLPAMPELGQERFSWTDFLLQQGPMLLMPVVFLGISGPSPWLLAFLFYPLFILGQLLWRRAREREKHDTAVGNWRASVDRSLSLLKESAVGEANDLQRLHPRTRELSERALYGREGLWTGETATPGAVEVSLGHGLFVSPSNASMPGDQTEGDVQDWRAFIESLRQVSDTPYVIDLTKDNVAIIGSGPRASEALAEALLRLCLTYSTTAVALAALLPTAGDDLARLEWAKWLPHFSNPTDAFAHKRFLHGAAECNQALRDAVTSLSRRQAHLVVLVHEASGVEIHLLEQLLEAGDGQVSILWYGVSGARVPDVISRIVRVNNDAEPGHLSAVVGPEGDGITVERHDEAGRQELTGISTRLAAFVDETGSAVSSSIPSQVALGATLPLDPTNLPQSLRELWTANSAAKHLVATLGVATGGTFDLDLAKQGPHMLIGGTTGSGKSELLRTFVLSLAARYSPRELSFILIDYKGLAALGDFKQLPHQVGLVSNLEASDVRRVIDFLRREIERRQVLLQEDQGEYVRYRNRLRKAAGQEPAKEFDPATDDGPLPRLIVVIDEFAGFAESDRKNIDAIVNIAARGRSLGVHLVLATQRPGTGIPREITANIDARFCLRTLDEQDSQAVIDTADASEIAKSLVGRAFARLSTGTLEQLQVSWAQAHSLKRRSMAKDLTISYFNPLVPTPHTESSSGEIGDEDDGQDEDTDFARLMRAMIEVAVDELMDIDVRRHREAEGVLLAPACNQTVLAPALAHELPQVTTPPPTRDPGDFPERLAIGLRDEPHYQRQSTEYVNLRTGGFIFSGPALSGRTEVLAQIARRFLYRTAGRLVIVDAGDGSLVKRLDGVEATTWISPSRDELEFLFEQLELNIAPPVEPVLVVIDRVDVIASQNKEVDRLASLIINGPSHNVFFAVSSDARVALEPALRNAFQWRYQSVTDYAGRALTSTDHLVQFFRVPPRGEQIPWPATRVRPLGLPPEDFPLRPATLPPNKLFLGIDEVRHDHVAISVRSGFTIAGGEQTGKTTTLLTLGLRIYQVTGRPVPLLAPYTVNHPAFVNVSDRAPIPRQERLWLQNLAPTIWSGSRSNFLLVDDVNRLGTYFPVAADRAFGPGEDEVLERNGARLIVAGDLGVLGYGKPSARIQGFSDRNFLVLQPPSELQVERHGLNIHWDAVVRPRTWRTYGPGEGVLVTPTSRFDTTVVPADELQLVFDAVQRFESSDRGEL